MADTSSDNNLLSEIEEFVLKNSTSKVSPKAVPVDENGEKHGEERRIAPKGSIVYTLYVHGMKRSETRFNSDGWIDYREATDASGHRVSISYTPDEKYGLPMPSKIANEQLFQGTVDGRSGSLIVPDGLQTIFDKDENIQQQWYVRNGQSVSVNPVEENALQLAEDFCAEEQWKATCEVKTVCKVAKHNDGQNIAPENELQKE